MNKIEVCKRCLLDIMLVLFSLSTLGQVESPLMSIYNKSNHGGGTQNWAINVAEEGVVLVGNNSGVLVFDGQVWNIQSLPNRTFVRSLYQSKEKDLFVGGQNEIGFYRNSQVKSDHYKSLREFVPSDYQDFEDVWKIFEIKGSIYFCTEKAIFRFTGDSCTVIEPTHDRFENFFSFNNQLYVQEFDLGLKVYNSNAFEDFIDDPLLRINRISEVISCDGDSLLIFTQNAGIYSYYDGVLSGMSKEVQNRTLYSKIYCATELHNGNIAVGTIQNGLLILSRNGEIIQELTEKDGLPNKTVLSLCEDRSGNIWLGLDNGLVYVEINSPFTKISEFSGVEGTGYAAIKRRDLDYFGTNLGLYQVSTDTLKTKVVSKVLSGQIWNLQDYEDGLIVSGDGGAKYFNGNSWVDVSNVRSSWKFLPVEGNRELYLQGTYSGLYLYKKSGAENQPLELIGKMEGFDESTRIFEFDSDGYVWVSHAYRGLFRLKPDYNNLGYSEIKRFGKSEGLPDDFYITVSKIRGELVFATEEGVFRFNKLEQRFAVHDEITQLLGPNKNVQRLIEDNLGNIWFSTANEFGLVHIRETGVYNNVEVIYFNQIQGDLVDGFENIFSTDDNIAYIPIEGGFYKYDLSLTERSPEFEYSLRIDEVYTTNGKDSVIFSFGSFDISKEYEHLNEESDLRFHFNLPTFGKLNEVAYSYKLENEDQYWSEWTNDHVKEYSNLSSGNYSFAVKAKDGFGRISEAASFDFFISPPWFKTIIAQVFFVVIGFLFILSFVKYISIREAKKTELVKQQSRITIQEKEQALQREKQKSESEIIRLRNEKLRAEVSHKNAELASTTMHLVQKSEMLQNVKKELTDLSKHGDDGLKSRIKQIQRLITDDVRLDKNWERFETHFDQVHENFFKNLRSKYPDLTPKDQKLCAYLRMNLATKEIAPLLNISVRGVEISRYRLRKKLELDSEVNLVSFIMEI